MPDIVTSRRALLAAPLVLAAVPARAQAPRQITLAHALPIDSHYGVAAIAFRDTLERVSNGRFKVIVQRNDNEREMVESLQIGTLDLCITSTGPVGNFVPEIRVVDVPFLFADYAQARGVLDSQIGADLLAKFPARGLIGLIWLENGFRNLTNSRHEVKEPADLQGLKIRTMENQVHMQAFRALGALPTPMAFSELVPALQQGTVDGQENPIPVIVANNLNQVQKYLSLTRHVYSPSLLLGSLATLGNLNDADKAAFAEAARAAQAANRNRVNEDEATGVEELRKRGMVVDTQVDTAAFQKALAPAYAQYEKELDAAMLRRIRAWKPD